MSKEAAVITVEEKMTPSARYYLLHREENNSKRLERYHSKPEVIAKREERERKKMEKEAEKAEKDKERERIRRERIQLAATTSMKKVSKKMEKEDEFLVKIPPDVGNN